MSAPGFVIKLAQPRGFCAGVDRAIDIVERALTIYGPPIYVRHEVVHNRSVVERLRKLGAHFIDDLNEVPPGNTLIFSAHGVSKTVQDEARTRNLNVLDATCPLVTKVHMEVVRFAKQGRECALIGHRGHPEVEGTMGQYWGSNSDGKGHIYLIEDETQARALKPQNPETLCYATQTTLSVDDTRAIIDILRQRFSAIEGPKTADICYATQNRQLAVRQLAQEAELVLVVGSPNSSNSNRLRELAARAGARSKLIDDPTDIDPKWLDGVQTVGVTAGASAPEDLVQDVVKYLRQLGARELKEMSGQVETINFPVPKQLRQEQ